MIQAFIVIVFFAEIIVVAKLISIIKNCNRKIIKIKQDVESYHPEILENLRNLSSVTEKTCLSAVAYKKKYSGKIFSMLLLKIFLAVFYVAIGKKWQRVIAVADIALNFNKKSNFGFLFELLKFFKNHVRICKKRGLLI